MVKLFSKNTDGVIAGYEHDQASDTLICRYSQDVEPILNYNKAMRNEGRRLKGGMEKVASIPNVLYTKWLLEEGFDALLPENRKELMRRLNGEYKYLKTTDYHL